MTNKKNKPLLGGCIRVNFIALKANFTLFLHVTRLKKHCGREKYDIKIFHDFTMDLRGSAFQELNWLDKDNLRKQSSTHDHAL